jgi:hypothetical protein
MATRTATQRSAAAKKAAATRKRNSAKRNSAQTKVSARRTASSARRSGRSAATTARSAQGTARQAVRSTGRRAEAGATRLDAVTKHAERAVFIPVGLVATARDSVADTVKRYSTRTRARRELNKFERRGASVLRRNRRSLERQTRQVRRDVARRTDTVQSGAESAVERVASLA